jgi:hypothetical protein
VSEVPFRTVSAIVSFFWNAGRALVKFLGPSWDGSRAKYRPEHHYMRGRGPKWHEKHGADRGQGVSA